MDAPDFMEIIAYKMLDDDKFKEKIEIQLSKEKSAEERSEEIRRLFRSLGGSKK